ncbi:MAG: hypothetical protein RL299_1362 [Pseudomonadota bacterium]
MNQRLKRLEAMRNNPRADWTIGDVRAACSGLNVSCQPPSNGSHWTVSDPAMEEILTIPARKPIKPPYIVALIKFLDEVQKRRTP